MTCTIRLEFCRSGSCCFCFEFPVCVMHKLDLRKQNWANTSRCFGSVPLLMFICTCFVFKSEFNIVKDVIQQCSNMLTVSTCSCFTLAVCTNDIASGLTESNNCRVAPSHFHARLHLSIEGALVVQAITRMKPNMVIP